MMVECNSEKDCPLGKTCCCVGNSCSCSCDVKTKSNVYQLYNILKPVDMNLNKRPVIPDGYQYSMIIVTILFVIFVFLAYFLVQQRGSYKRRTSLKDICCCLWCSNKQDGAKNVITNEVTELKVEKDPTKIKNSVRFLEPIYVQQRGPTWKEATAAVVESQIRLSYCLAATRLETIVWIISTFTCFLWLNKSTHSVHTSDWRSNNQVHCLGRISELTVRS